MWARSSLDKTPQWGPCPHQLHLLLYSSPRCLCSSKKSMLTFSQHLQNDLEEEGRTDVGKVLIANISSTFCYHFAGGWSYSSPRCLCSSKKSMLTFSKHIQNDLEEEGRTDVGKVLIGQNSPMRTLPTSAPPSSILLAKVLVLKQKVYAHLLSTPTKWPRGRR